MVVWAAAVWLACATGVGAQLRPLDPAPWSIFESGATAMAWIGAGVYEAQRASLAGTRGRLAELGNVNVLWRAGRIALHAGGTALRVFDDRASWGDPIAGARPRSERLRVDAGDWRVSTLLRLTAAGSNPGALLRFGVRLPTTDNGVGLGRDRTDFFGALSGRLEWRDWRLIAESGLGIHGTRDPLREQWDVWIYAAKLGFDGGVLRPSLAVVGHADGREHGPVRGNEDLSELRLGLRIGDRDWVRIQAVRGLARFSPPVGVRIGVGTSLPRGERRR